MFWDWGLTLNSTLNYLRKEFLFRITHINFYTPRTNQLKLGFVCFGGKKEDERGQGGEKTPQFLTVWLGRKWRGKNSGAHDFPHGLTNCFPPKSEGKLRGKYMRWRVSLKRVVLLTRMKCTIIPTLFSSHPSSPSSSIIFKKKISSTISFSFTFLPYSKF